MTENEAIKHLQSYAEVVDNMIKYCKDFEPKADITGYLEKKTVFAMAISAIKEVQQYREIGTVEECKKAVREEDALKFYYCESEDDYYIGKRVGNFYYARYGETGFEWFMSRYLPWGEHVIAPNTLWKEHTYPSEPKEIPFFEWLQGFIKRYCGGTVEECREAVWKQKPKKRIYPKTALERYYHAPECPNCKRELKPRICGYTLPQAIGIYSYCPWCGQNLEGGEESEEE